MYEEVYAGTFSQLTLAPRPFARLRSRRAEPIRFWAKIHLLTAEHNANIDLNVNSHIGWPRAKETLWGKWQKCTTTAPPFGSSALCVFPDASLNTIEEAPGPRFSRCLPAAEAGRHGQIRRRPGTSSRFNDSGVPGSRRVHPIFCGGPRFRTHRHAIVNLRDRRVRRAM